MTSPSTAELTIAAATVETTSLLGHARALQSALGDLSTLTVSQLVTLFHRNQKRKDFPQLLKEAVPQIISPHTQAAADLTAQWFDDLTNKTEAIPVVDIPTERIDKTVDWALYAPTEKRPSGLLFRPTTEGEPSSLHVWEEDPDITLGRLAGSAKRMVYDASRDTVVTNANQQGLKWARLAQPDACAFCRLLATRDAVYASEKSATTVVGAGKAMSLADRRARASGNATGVARRQAKGQKGQFAAAGVRIRGTQKLGDKYHDHCRCVATPVPSGEVYTPPDYTEQWQQDYIAATRAARKAGQTKGKYGAIDVKAVLAHMRANTDAR